MGTSPFKAWKALSMRGSFFEDLTISLESLVLIRPMKRDWGKRVTPSLSLSNLGIRLGCQERVSGAERSFSGIWMSFRSKSKRSSIHHACCLLSFLGSLKYRRFLWLVNTCTGNGEPYK